MAQKRPQPAALPIFNKGKRPRKALIAHPNNNNGGCSSYERPASKESNMSWQFGKENRNQQSFPKQQKQTNFGAKNSFDDGTSYQRMQKKSIAEPENWNFDENFPPHHQGGKQRVGTVFSAAEPNAPSPQFTAAGVGSSTARAQEPIEKAKVQNRPEVSRKRELRVLTATAQGIEHWSQYSQHTQLLFEVYGRFVSADQQDQLSCRFTLKTKDGPLYCIYWKMEQSFPQSVTTPGQVVRVVGDWQPQQKRLQCYSIRPTQHGEADFADQCIMAADRHMRKMVGAGF